MAKRAKSGKVVAVERTMSSGAVVYLKTYVTDETLEGRICGDIVSYHERIKPLTMRYVTEYLAQFPKIQAGVIRADIEYAG